MGQSDICLKRYLSDEARFADLINGVIGEGEQLVTAADLTDMDTQVGYRDTSCEMDESISNEKRRSWQGYRDLLKKVAFGVNFVVIGIENQEHSNYLMPLRCMGYDVREYERQASVEKAKIPHWKKMLPTKQSELTQAEFLSGVRKDIRLYPCITIVLYFGEEWDAARSMHELMDFSGIPDKFRDIVNDYRMYFVDVRSMKDTECFRTDLRQVFGCISKSKDKDTLYRYMADNPELTELEEDAYDVIARYTDISKQGELSKESKAEGGRINMCRAMRELKADWFAEGKAEGKAEGMAEGKAELILILLKRIGQISDELFQRVMQERDNEVLCNWAALAVGAKSIAEFEMKMG